MKTADKLKAIGKVLKEKFTNLSVDETIELSAKILGAIEEQVD